ncbi:MAG: TolC family protein [Pirellulaceae bacterium]
MCRLKAMLLALMVVSCLLLGQARSSDPQTSDKKATSASIQKLMKERVETLQRLVKIMEQSYREGAVDFARVNSAQSALLEALVEAAQSKKERIELLKQYCSVLEGAVAIAQTKFEQGAVNESDAVQARAGLLLGKIRLLQAEDASEEQDSHGSSMGQADTPAPRMSRSPDLESKPIMHCGRPQRLSRWGWNRCAP